MYVGDMDASFGPSKKLKRLNETEHNIHVEYSIKKRQWVARPKMNSPAAAKVRHALRRWRTSAISGPYGGILHRILLYILKPG